MASILVVGQEQRSLERFHRVLSAEGWRVRVAQGRAQALQAAALEPPDLVLAGAEVPGAEELAGAFRRSAGGPGIVVVMPESGLPTGPAVLGDDRLRMPFGDHDLVVTVRRLLAVAREAGAPAAPPVRLTSQEIFGDVLAEVEGQFAAKAAASSPPPVHAARPASWRDDGEMQRRLDETLSGVMRAAQTGTAAGSAAAPGVSTRRRDTGGADVEALLNRTLSELGGRPRGAGAAPTSGAGAGAPTGGPKRAVPAAATASPAQATAAPIADASAPRPADASAAGSTPAGGAMPAAASVAKSGAAQGKSAAAPAAAAASAFPAAGGGAITAGQSGVPAPLPAPSSFPSPTPAREGSGVRRRLTGELDLAQLEALARPRRKLEPSSRPGIAAASSSTPASPAPAGAKVADDSPAATQRIQMVPREPAEPGEKFGQYTLLERIAVGGMAEVWKARMRGVEGFQKTVAIKKILPYMTDNADFVSMFIDEAKLAAQLGHPNIVHIYDLGKIGADYYIAMEYVEGKDLRSLLNAARQRGMALPLGLALLIAMRLASALAYAHRKRDFEGREIGLVHRDVSPQNVLISFDGEVKLCDFGIAKAVSKVGQTQMGALKGKLQYMSPEQAMGTPVDARSDIFSLGTVLFEMLTGQRLFAGDSEMSVLEAVRQVKVRSPRQVDPSVPAEVDEIVMRALAGRPEDRFQSAAELEQRLEAVLYALKPSPSHSDLAAFVRRALDQSPAPALRAERRQPSPPPTPPPAVQAPAAQAAHSLPTPLALFTAAAAAAASPASPSSPGVAAGVAAAAGVVATPVSTTSPAAFAPASAGSAATPLSPLGDSLLAAEGSRPGRTMLAAAAAVLVVVALLTYMLVGRRNPNPQLGVPAAGAPTAGATAAGAAAGAPGDRRLPAGLAGPGGPTAGPTGGQTGSSAPGGAAAAKGTVAGGKTAPATAAKVDVQGVVDQELARRAAAMKQKFDEQQKQLQKEIDKTQSAKAQPETPAPPASTASGGTSPAAQAGAGASPGEPSRAAQRSGAANGTEPRSAVEPPATAPAAAAAAGSAGGAEGGQKQEAAKERAAEPAGRTPAATAGSTAAGAVTVPPKLVSSQKPEYPPLARKLRSEGVVVLSVLVDEQGRVEDVQLLDSQNVEFNAAALQVARGARFKPASRDGVPVKMWTRLRIPFKL